MSSNNEEKNLALNFLAGLGLGALVGAAAALLLAPKPGTETRQDLADAADELKVKANKVVQDISHSSDELVKKSKELIQVTKDKVQSAVEAGKQAVAKKVEEEAEEEMGESEA